MPYLYQGRDEPEEEWPQEDLPICSQEARRPDGMEEGGKDCGGVKPRFDEGGPQDQSHLQEGGIPILLWVCWCLYFGCSKYSILDIDNIFILNSSNTKHLPSQIHHLWRTHHVVRLFCSRLQEIQQRTRHGSVVRQYLDGTRLRPFPKGWRTSCVFVIHRTSTLIRSTLACLGRYLRYVWDAHLLPMWRSIIPYVLT